MPVDPYDYRIDEPRYRRRSADWLDELDAVVVHHGEPHQRMGTRLVPEHDWLVVDDLYEPEVRLRRRLLDEATDEVFAAVDDDPAASEEVADLVDAWLGTHAPDRVVPDLVGAPHPLVRAARLVQEDLCVMERRPEGWVLTAAVVCFPSYWRLGDKIGRPQAAIHGPVPHYAPDLEAKVDRFFDRLAPGRVVLRRNWGFSAHPLLFVPRLAALDNPDHYDPDLLWLRSERQTLRRMPATGAVLFTIKVQLAPARAVEGRPALAGLLRAAIEGWTPELVASRGGRHGWVADVRAWLAGIEGSDAPQAAGPPGRPAGDQPVGPPGRSG